MRALPVDVLTGIDWSLHRVKIEGAHFGGELRVAPELTRVLHLLLDLLHKNALTILSSLNLLLSVLIFPIVVLLLLLTVEVLLIIVHLVLIFAGVVGLDRNALLLQCQTEARYKSSESKPLLKK